VQDLVISIHTLRVEGDFWRYCDFIVSNIISIHTLRVEGDCSRADYHKLRQSFQSTPSGWRVTAAEEIDTASKNISIHTLRVEGD